MTVPLKEEKATECNKGFTLLDKDGANILFYNKVKFNNGY